MFRGRVSYPLHAALELLTASGLLLAPFVLGLSIDAAVTTVVIGAVLFGLALSATESGGRGTMPMSAHATYDAAIALVLIAASAIFAVAGQPAAMLVLLAAGLAQLTLNGLTRYSPART